MIAILLCAGFGTRMYPLTQNHPKPLLEVAGRPVIDYLLDQIMSFNEIEGIHIVVNKKFHSDFTRWKKTWQSKIDATGIEIIIYDNGVENNSTRLGAIGDLAFVLNSGNLSGRDALIAAGDNIFLFDISPFWNNFIKFRANQIFALRATDEERLKRSGVVVFDKDLRVTDFQEKPEKPKSEWLCPALYFLSQHGLCLLDRYLDNTDRRDALGDFIRFLVFSTEVNANPIHDNLRFDIGSIEDYRLANEMLQR